MDRMTRVLILVCFHSTKSIYCAPFLGYMRDIFIPNPNVNKFLSLAFLMYL